MNITAAMIAAPFTIGTGRCNFRSAILGGRKGVPCSGKEFENEYELSR